MSTTDAMGHVICPKCQHILDIPLAEQVQAAYSQGYKDAREACQAAVASELYGHDTGDMGNRIQEAISSLPIPEAK